VVVITTPAVQRSFLTVFLPVGVVAGNLGDAERV
jgi:hypothetical protein